MKEISIKKKILNKLEGEFEVTKVEKQCWDSGICIVCEFINRGKKGSFEYTLEGGERCPDEIQDEKGNVYIDDDDENIYNEITKWVEEHIDWWVEVEWDGKKVV